MLIYLYRCCVIYLLCCLFIALLHAYSIGVLLSLYLYFIFVPYFDLYFFMIVVAVSLYHLAFYVQRYGGSVRYQTPGKALFG